MTSIVAHTADWLLTWLVHASLACGVALVVGRRLKGAGARDILWKSALVAPLATSLLVVSVVPERRAHVDVATVGRHVVPRAVQRTHVSVTPGRAPGATVVTVRDDAARVMQYGILALVLVPGLIASWRTVARRRRHRAALRARHAVTARELGVDIDALPHGLDVRLSVSPRVDSAAAVGLREICVSESLVALRRVEREAVIAHELAHLGRRDVPWAMFADTVACLLAIQPLVRMVASRYRRDAEFICDEIAVRRVGDAGAYVRTLLAFAAPYDAAAGVPAYGGSPIVQRAERLLAGRAAHRRSDIVIAALVMAILVGGLIALPRLHLGDQHVAVHTLAGSRTAKGVRTQVQVSVGAR